MNVVTEVLHSLRSVGRGSITCFLLYFHSKEKHCESWFRVDPDHSKDDRRSVSFPKELLSEKPE